MRNGSGFWDRIAERYAKKPVADEATYQKKLAITRAYFQPDAEVFEFGCGTGSTAIAHAPFVKRIRAIDLSTKMIEIARRKADAGEVENVSFETKTIDEFDAPERSFDAVMGHSILHLLPRRETAIAKAHRLLKPGGVFVTSTACLGDTMKWFKLVGPIGRILGLIPLVRIFTKSQLLDSVTAAGFEIEEEWQPGKGKSVFLVAKKAG